MTKKSPPKAKCRSVQESRGATKDTSKAWRAYIAHYEMGGCNWFGGEVQQLWSRGPGRKAGGTGVAEGVT